MPIKDLIVDGNHNGTVPAVYDNRRYAPAPLPGATYTVMPEQEQAQTAVPLAHYLWLIRRHLWSLLLFIGICMIATLLVSLRLTPVYEAIATVDIDRQSPPGIIGQESTRAALNDADQFLATQVKLVQSDSVLRPIVEKYRLREVEGWAKDSKNAQDDEDAPVILKKLKVTRPPNTYLLLINYRSTNPKLASNVANGIANSYIEHTFDLRFKASASLAGFMEKQIEALKAKMELSTAALAQFERELNVINPEEKTSILSSRLLQLNTEYTNAQADRVRKEAAARSLSTGTLEAAQSSTQGESLRKLAEHMSEAQEKFAQVQAQYGVNHPEYRRAETQVAEIQRLLEKTRQNIAQRVGVEHREAINREQMLQRAVNETKAEFDRLNARSFQYQQLKREADSDKKLYEEIATRIKEAGINANFQNSSIRLADAARSPVKPVFPNVKLNLILAFLFSTMLGVGAAVFSDVLDTTVRDPEQVSRFLGTDVIGTLPAVKNMGQLNVLEPPPSTELATTNGNGKNGHHKKGYHKNGYYRTISGYGEAIRTLRNTILLGDFDGRLKSILITSAGPGEGKSTTAVHLAIANAEQGKRTLLVDADLRRPSVHRKLGLSSDVGLSDILTGDRAWRETIQYVDGKPNLSVIPAGPPSHRAADVIGPRMADLVDEFSREFDLIILDAPPLLGFAEPLQMATTADGVLIVSRAGETKRKAVSSVISALTRLRANVVGVVLNQVKRDTSAGYSYYGYYRNKYYYGDRES